MDSRSYDETSAAALESVGIVTIVVPTFNRSHWVTPLMRYFAECSPSLPILVVDSSSNSHALEQNVHSVQAVISSIPAKHLRYSASTSVYSKLIDALSTISTPYVAICADDDFLVPSGVLEAAEFLDSNREYSAAHGASLLVTAPDGLGPPGAKSGLRSFGYPLSTLVSDDAGVRVRKHLADYRATFYSVHRREQLIANLLNVEANTSDHLFAELLSSALTVAQGKVRAFDNLYMVRRGGTASASSIEPWRSLVVSETFSERYMKFRSSLIRELQASDAEAAPTAVDEGFSAFLARAIKQSPVVHGSNGARDRIRQRPAVGRNLRRALAPLARRVRPLLVRARAASQNSTIPPDSGDDISLELLLGRRSIYRAELEPIVRALND